MERICSDGRAMNVIASALLDHREKSDPQGFVDLVVEMVEFTGRDPDVVVPVKPVKHLSRAAAALLALTAAAHTRGDLDQTERERLDDWIIVQASAAVRDC